MTHPDDELLGRIALHFNLVTPEQLTLAAQQTESSGLTLADQLVETNVITMEQFNWLNAAQEQYKAKQKSTAGPNNTPATGSPSFNVDMSTPLVPNAASAAPAAAALQQPQPQVSSSPSIATIAPSAASSLSGVGQSGKHPVFATPSKGTFAAPKGSITRAASGATFASSPSMSGAPSAPAAPAPAPKPPPEPAIPGLQSLAADVDDPAPELQMPDGGAPVASSASTIAPSLGVSVAPSIAPAIAPMPPPSAPRSSPSMVPQTPSSGSMPAFQSQVSGISLASNPPSVTLSGARGKLPTLEQILTKAVSSKASDVHMHAGSPLQMRIGGTLRELRTGVLEAHDLEGILKDALTPEQRKQLEETLELDAAIHLPVGRFRASFYKQQRGWDAVFRTIPPEPPTLKDLGLPDVLTRFTEYHQGLVLLTGPAGCGKSSTLAALVNMLNESRHDHIITVEDPIEYIHKPKKCLVNQRQTGKHTKTFANALRAALREDPDIIVIGELRDLETIQLAITAAETGHLVLGTLHTNNAIRTINRILDVFPPKQQSQIRAMVSESLRAICSQRLLPSADGTKRVAAVETLFVKPSISNLIREEKTFQIRSIMQTGRAQGMWLLDDALTELVKSGQVKKEDARRAAEDPKRFA